MFAMPKLIIPYKSLRLVKSPRCPEYTMSQNFSNAQQGCKRIDLPIRVHNRPETVIKAIKGRFDWLNIIVIAEEIPFSCDWIAKLGRVP